MYTAHNAYAYLLSYAYLYTVVAIARSHSCGTYPNENTDLNSDDKGSAKLVDAF